MVRRDLGRHEAHAAALGLADQLDAPGRADVLHVVAAADRAVQHQVARDHQLFRFRGTPGHAEDGRDQASVHRAAGEGEGRPVEVGV